MQWWLECAAFPNPIKTAVGLKTPFVSLPHKDATGMMHVVKYCEIIADNLSKAGWSWGCVSAGDSRGRTIFVADAHRDGGQRFIVRADERLSAFVELESAVRIGQRLAPSLG